MATRWLGWISLALCCLGVGVSGYLVWSKYGGGDLICVGFGGCDVVQNSRYAMVGVVPVALIGLSGYLLLGVALSLSLLKGPVARPALLVSLGGVVVGVLYSGYLTYVELFVLNAVCVYCVVSALIMVALCGCVFYRTRYELAL